MSTPWPIGNPFLARRAVAIALVALVLPSFASCNHEPQITEVDYLYAEPGKVYFFNQPKDRDDDDDAEITGTLLLVDGCLRIETPYVAPDWYSAVVWPKEYDLVIEEREIAILNPDGERAGRRRGSHWRERGRHGPRRPHRRVSGAVLARQHE
jgi:hypothetical protein